MISETQKKYYNNVPTNTLNDECLLVCENGNLEALRYLLMNPKLNKHVYLIYSNKHTYIKKACINGHLNIVKYLFKSTGVMDHEVMKLAHYDALILSSGQNHIDVLQYLLNSKEFRKFINMDIIHESFMIACKNGHLEVIKSILMSPDLKSMIDIKSGRYNLLTSACFYNQLEIIKYLLTSPEIEQNFNIHTQKDMCLVSACKKNNLEIMKYLLTSPDLKEHANIYTKDNMVFEWACELPNPSIINYLIFDYKIIKTPIIENYINLTNEVNIMKLFEKRDLHEALQKDLEKNTISTNRVKI